MARTADVLVAGVGGCGASALYHLARRGLRVIGLDRFPPGHDRGSSHGDTRVIRQAYFEHPDYVPLLRRAYGLWREIEEEAEEDLLELCGLLMVGPRDGEIVQGSRLAAQRYGVPLEEIDGAAAASRFPAVALPDGFAALWEPLGGYLRVEDCVRAYANGAVRHGAELRTGEGILGWSAGQDGVRVETDRETYEADRLVLCPGAWAPVLLADVGIRFEVLRKVLVWYGRQGGAPVPEHTFFFEMPYGLFYGFPSLDGRSVKLAEHSGGAVVGDPLTLDRTLGVADMAGPDRFVNDTFRGLVSPPVRHAVCMYTATPDQHFVVDHHPAHANVVFAAGFSGHGFKFMSAMGAVLAEMSIDGRTDSPIEFLGLSRFAA